MMSCSGSSTAERRIDTDLISESKCSPGVFSPGRNLKEWLQEQFCDKPLEQDDMRLHNAAYVGDLDTLRNLLQESEFKRWAGLVRLQWEGRT